MGPDYTQPDIATPDGWNAKLQGGLTPEVLEPTSLKQWWGELGDPLLTQLIGDAVLANLDLRTADAQLRQARAERGRSRGALFPTLGARGSATRRGEQREDVPDTTSKLYSGGFDASWEIDVFGGVRRAIEAAEADEQAANESRRDVLVSLLAEVALNYTEFRTFQSRLAFAQHNLANQEETLEIVDAQVAGGAASELDLQQAKSNVAKTRAELPTLAQNASRAKNRLSLLLGEAPGSRDAALGTRTALSVPPVEISVGVPAEILRRRPDVRGAERKLAAETARVGVATAELYPKFILNGSIGIESVSVAGVSSAYSIGPELQWKIFSGGRVRREIEIQNAVQEQALIAYEAAVLGALEDVDNSITAFALEQVRLRSLRESSDAAAYAARLAKIRYESGASPFLEVLDAQRTEFAAQDAVAASEGEVLSNLIRLYKALGGGWESLEPESSPDSL